MSEPTSETNGQIKLKITIFGALTFIPAFIGFVLSLYAVITEENNQENFQMTHTLQHVWNMNINRNIIDLVAGIMGVVFLLAMIFSILLLIGINKNKPGFVLAYFGYGAMLTMLMILSAVLELIQSYWALAFSTIGFSILYIYWLHFVHTVYEKMQKGLVFGSDGHNLLENEQINI